MAEWLHLSLRPLFSDQWPDPDAYATEYDRAEVILGVLHQDIVNLHAAADSGHSYWGSHWFGRSTYRSHHREGSPVEDLTHELATHGSLWEPLRANLFGGDEARADAALEKYGEKFNRIARR
ncbi:MAG: hypothetical protein M3P91_07430 [Actinomycetota bacterium]|nr:hypothetical protein [Actinomycetota bacterium]